MKQFKEKEHYCWACTAQQRNQEAEQGSAEAFMTAVTSLADHCEKLSESLQLNPDLTLVKTTAAVCHSEKIKQKQPNNDSLNER